MIRTWKFLVLAGVVLALAAGLGEFFAFALMAALLPLYSLLLASILLLVFLLLASVIVPVSHAIIARQESAIIHEPKDERREAA